MSDKKLIAVCGATGSQGGSVLKYLIESGKFRVRALTRNVLATKAIALKKWGSDVELWQCDMANADEVIKAFEGCWAAFMLTDFWSNPEKMVKEEINYGRILIDAAVTAKVTFGIYSSLPNVEIITEGRFQVPHFTSKNLIEEYARNEFRDKDIQTSFGFVYPGFYLQNFAYLPGMALKISQNGALENDPLPLKPTVEMPVLNVEEFGKWVFPMFDQWEHFKNNIVYASSGYITIPKFMEIVSKHLGVEYNYKLCSSDEYYNQTQSTELVHMLEYFNEYGYYNGAQLGNFKSFAPDVLSLEDSILSIDWKSFVTPGITQQLSSKISDVSGFVGEKLGGIKDTIVDTASSLRDKVTDTLQKKTDSDAESAF